MKKIAIVSIGMSKKTITAEAMEAIENAEALFGSKRLMAEFAYLEKPSFNHYKPKAVRELMDAKDYNSYAILVSGDSGFYSAATSLLKVLGDCDVRLYPGVSSPGYFFSRLQIPWQDAKLLSVHGITANVADHVRRNRYVFCLTGSNTDEIGKDLCDAGFEDLTVHVGENLGHDDERIYSISAHELSTRKIRSLSVLLIENPRPDKGIYTGIADDKFSRLDGIPMTKSEVRSLIASKLSLTPKSVCYDIGAGTGSVSVEMALSAYEGRVYAVEAKEEALPLIRENCRRFHLGNVEVIGGKAPEALDSLPAPDAVFIGGSSGEISSIVECLKAKNPDVRIVISAIAIESAYGAIKALDDPEIIQISASRGKKAGSLNLMLGQNPIYIISGGAK